MERRSLNKYPDLKFISVILLALTALFLINVATAAAASHSSHRPPTYRIGEKPTLLVEPSLELRARVLRDGYLDIEGSKAIVAYLNSAMAYAVNLNAFDAEFLDPEMILTFDVRRGNQACEFVQEIEAYRDLNRNQYRDDEDEYFGSVYIPYKTACE